jgi:hypothetical protein
MLFYLFWFEVHGLQLLRRALGPSTIVGVITLRRICSTLRRSITPIAQGEAEVAAKVVEAIAEIGAVEAVEEVEFDAFEEFAVGFARTTRRA